MNSAHLRSRRPSLAKGKRVLLRASVAAGATGQVVFRSGGRTLCVATIEDGVAKCEARLKPGTWKVKAKYAGSATYAKDKAVFTVRKR